MKNKSKIENDNLNSNDKNDINSDNKKKPITSVGIKNTINFSSDNNSIKMKQKLSKSEMPFLNQKLNEDNRKYDKKNKKEKNKKDENNNDNKNVQCLKEGKERKIDFQLISSINNIRLPDELYDISFDILQFR